MVDSKNNDKTSQSPININESSGFVAKHSEITNELKHRNNARSSRSSTLDSNQSNSSASSTSSASSSSLTSTSTSSSSKRRSKRHKSFINIAPLNTPLQHRLETVGVIWHCISIPFFICLFLLMISLGWIVWVVIILPYFIWWYGFDLHTPTNGKGAYRVRDSVKNLIIWEWFVNYFPISAHKMVELEPTFNRVLVEDSNEDDDDDEQDLISESQLTTLDQLFKFFGLKKRINTTEFFQSKSNSSAVYKRVSTGPRYIFGYHPHGVISMGAVGLFGTNALRNEPYEPLFKWLKPFFHDPSKHKPLFPGIGKIFPLTLTTQFTVPFYRDYSMALGISSASAKNIKSLISNGDNSVCLVVGGAQESLLNTMVAKSSRIGHGYKDDTEDVDETEEEEHEENEENKDPKEEKGKHEGVKEAKEQSVEIEKPIKREVKLVLNKRKGFIKLAIELGNVSLVPTFAFGEADVYKLTMPPPGSLGYKFQQWMKKTFAFTIPFFSARGVFIYDFGLLPYRNPINIVMGKPIHVPEGALQDYKSKHPEEFESESSQKTSPTDLNAKEGETQDKSKLAKSTISKPPKMKKTNSFTDIFKSKKPSTPKPKAKVPQQLLDFYHKQYVDELKRVYNENRERFGYGDVELNIIE